MQHQIIIGSDKYFLLRNCSLSLSSSYHHIFTCIMNAVSYLYAFVVSGRLSKHNVMEIYASLFFKGKIYASLSNFVEVVLLLRNLMGGYSSPLLLAFPSLLSNRKGTKLTYNYPPFSVLVTPFSIMDGGSRSMQLEILMTKVLNEIFVCLNRKNEGSCL